MDSRIALCIGVANYNEPALQLRNPLNDARLVNETLRVRGFDSTLLLNPTAAELTESLTDLRSKIGRSAGGRAFSVVFYAGHAIEIGGFGVLLPADMPHPVSQGGIEHFGIPLLEVVDAMNNGRGPKVVIVDACRSSMGSWDGAQMTRFNDWASGEAERKTDAAKARDVAIAYSTAQGQQAYDGLSLNSLYCEKLVSALLRHDVSIVEALTLCGQQVIADTRAKQQPWVYTNLSLKASFSDLPIYALKSSTILTGKLAGGTRLLKGSADDTMAVNLVGRLQFLREGKEVSHFAHPESFTTVAVWKDEILFAGPNEFVSVERRHKRPKAKLQPKERLETRCTEPHGISVSPDGASAIIYGQGGYSLLERLRKGWRIRYTSEQPSDVYSAIFRSDSVAYICGSGDYLVQLSFSGHEPPAKEIPLGCHLHVYDIAWVEERQSIAAVCGRGIVAWIDPATGTVSREKMFDWPSVDVPGAYGRLRRMELSATEATLYLTDRQRFETEFGSTIWYRDFNGIRPSYDLYCCAVTADNRVLAIGVDLGLIFLVDVRSNTHFATLDVGSDIGAGLQWMDCAASGEIHGMARDGVLRSFEAIDPSF